MLWQASLAVAFVALAVGTDRSRTPLFALAGAQLAGGFAAFFVGDSVGIGDVDSYGDHPLATDVSVVLSSVLTRNRRVAHRYVVRPAERSMSVSLTTAPLPLLAGRPPDRGDPTHSPRPTPVLDEIAAASGLAVVGLGWGVLRMAVVAEPQLVHEVFWMPRRGWWSRR